MALGVGVSEWLSLGFPNLKIRFYIAFFFCTQGKERNNLRKLTRTSTVTDEKISQMVDAVFYWNQGTCKQGQVLLNFL